MALELDANGQAAWPDGERPGTGVPRHYRGIQSVFGYGFPAAGLQDWWMLRGIAPHIHSCIVIRTFLLASVDATSKRVSSIIDMDQIQIPHRFVSSDSTSIPSNNRECRNAKRRPAHLAATLTEPIAREEERFPGTQLREKRWSAKPDPSHSVFLWRREGPAWPVRHSVNLDGPCPRFFLLLLGEFDAQDPVAIVRFRFLGFHGCR